MPSSLWWKLIHVVQNMIYAIPTKSEQDQQDLYLLPGDFVLSLWRTCVCCVGTVGRCTYNLSEHLVFVPGHNRCRVQDELVRIYRCFRNFFHRERYHHWAFLIRQMGGECESYVTRERHTSLWGPTWQPTQDSVVSLCVASYTVTVNFHLHPLLFYYLHLTV